MAAISTIAGMELASAHTLEDGVMRLRYHLRNADRGAPG